MRFARCKRVKTPARRWESREGLGYIVPAHCTILRQVVSISVDWGSFATILEHCRGSLVAILGKNGMAVDGFLAIQLLFNCFSSAFISRGVFGDFIQVNTVDGRTLAIWGQNPLYSQAWNGRIFCFISFMWHCDLHSHQLMPHAHCGRQFLPRCVFAWPVWNWIKWLMTIFFFVCSSWYFKFRFSSDLFLYNACTETWLAISDWDAFSWDTCLCKRFDKVSVKGEGIGEKGQWFRWFGWWVETVERSSSLSSWSACIGHRPPSLLSSRGSQGQLGTEIWFNLDIFRLHRPNNVSSRHFRTPWSLHIFTVCSRPRFTPFRCIFCDWGRETFIAKVQMYRAWKSMIPWYFE